MGFFPKITRTKCEASASPGVGCSSFAGPLNREYLAPPPHHQSSVIYSVRRLRTVAYLEVLRVELIRCREAIEMFEVIAIDRTGGPDPSGGIHYNLHVRSPGHTALFTGSTSPGQEAMQIDWSDDFQDLLMTHGADFRTMSLLMFRAHTNEPVVFPVAIGMTEGNK